MIIFWLAFLSLICVAYSSYFSVSTYATTSDTAIYSSAGSTLDVFTPISGVLDGSWIGARVAVNLVCQDTSSTQTTTSRAYIFSYLDDYVKMLRVQFTLTSGTIYWKATNARYYTNPAYGTTCTNVVGTAYPGGTAVSIATCDVCDNYGVASMTYDISNAPTSQPSRQPTSQPSRQPTSAPTTNSTFTYYAYATTSDVSLFSKTGLTTLNMFTPITFTAFGAWVTYGTIGRLLCQDTNSAQTSTSRVYIFSWTEDGYLKMIKVQFTLSSSTIYYKAITARYTSSSYGSDCTTMVGTGYPSATTEPLATCDGCDGYGISSLTYIITDAPTSQPSSRPSSQPSRQPSRQPTTQPSSRPSRRPSSQPTFQPTSRPSYHQGGSSFLFADYATLSDVAIYYNSAVTLDLFTPVSGTPSGGAVGTSSNIMWCKDTTSTQTSTSQTYIFSFTDNYLKFIRVVFTLTSGTIYWRGVNVYYYSDMTQATSCTKVINALSSATSNGANVATCATCDFYGVKSFVFTVMNSPTVCPSYGPTQVPTTMTPSVLPTTISPTQKPSLLPSVGPSVSPSELPSAAPSVDPTQVPTTFCPSLIPTTIVPTQSPTVLPSIGPSVLPSVQPTSALPSAAPSVDPTQVPTTFKPSVTSLEPTAVPSTSKLPSIAPFSTIDAPTVSPTLDSSTATSLLKRSSVFKVKNPYAFAALNESGHVFTWGKASKGGDSSSVSQYFKNVTAVVSSHHAFAALNSDGSVVAWGEATSISGWSEYLSGTTTVASVYATESAFALLTTDGAVHAFGHSSHGGRLGDVSSDVSSGVVGVVGNAGAFAAWKSDGSVYCWGSAFTGGGVSSATMSSLVNVVEVYASRGAFAARLSDGSVLSWGDRNCGGDSFSESASNVIHIIGSVNMFTAVRSDSSLVSWGAESKVVGVDDGSNVYVAHCDFSGAVLKYGGSVTVWGDQGELVVGSLVNIVQIYSNKVAYAALNTSGAVIAWGSESQGGDTSSVASDLTSDVVSVAATNYAFAALKSDGSVVVWGDASYGGSVSADVSAKLVDVVKVCSNDLSFTAIKSDGEGIVWGHSHVTGGCGDACVLENAVLISLASC